MNCRLYAVQTLVCALLLQVNNLATTLPVHWLSRNLGRCLQYRPITHSNATVYTVSLSMFEADHAHRPSRKPCLITQSATATPASWVSKWLNVPSNNLGCIDHPTKTYASHAAPSGLTSSILFTITNSVGATVSSVCPGQTYGVQVSSCLSG
jgi:hypothetical protein